jgi:hypothetical protein
MRELDRATATRAPFPAVFAPADIADSLNRVCAKIAAEGIDDNVWSSLVAEPLLAGTALALAERLEFILIAAGFRGVPRV